jgi:hypothetical protein
MNEIKVEKGNVLDIDYDGMQCRITALGTGVLEIRPLNAGAFIGRTTDFQALWIVVEPSRR